ncbi:vinculin-like isoform X3 [Pomacea canaliculata]|uniref:vinculin-like isoform X3 n=1 Tax=Pomacea canaliculata TaxID=400727 RepID=UPI000D73014E|nr:vinculin-like isoform X3 [Pomacea canaliculata]
MPVFHTKTIESILEPVAQQVSRLVILHEEAEDGNAMPDLAVPVRAVKAAVDNLVRVGYETVNSSDDQILKQDMPPALTRVEESSLLLLDASDLLRADPYSGPARKKLIEGSRGILQGTSALLLAFDESEVRKIVRVCKNVLEYLAITEVVDRMEDLVTFVKNLSPVLTRMTKNVDAREKELTHQVHRDMLLRSLEQVKNLTPVLISGIKIFITAKQSGQGLVEAQNNRDYTVRKMSDEIHEIIRVLQLTTYDEEEWDADDLTVMKKAQNAIEGKMQSAQDWLQDPAALVGSAGDKALKQILDDARRIADRCTNRQERDTILKNVSDIESMANALSELRQQGKGSSPQALSLAREIQNKLRELQKQTANSITSTERSGIRKPAPTVDGKVEQARQWLANPGLDDKGLGEAATRLVVEEGRRVANCCTGPQRQELLRLCDETEILTNQLADLCRRGQGNGPQAKAIARNLSEKLAALKTKIQDALVSQVAEDFIDISTPLKQLSEAAIIPVGTPGREANFEEKARKFQAHAQRLADTANSVATAGGCPNKQTVEAIFKNSAQVKDLTPQIVNAARVLFTNPNNQAAVEHFELLKKQWTENMERLRSLVDEAVDTGALIRAEEEGILRDTERIEDGIRNIDSPLIVTNASSIARRANRVLQVAEMEAQNSEDPLFVDRVNEASENLKSSITPMVQNAKVLSTNPQNSAAASSWRKANQQLISAVGGVREAVSVRRDGYSERFPPPPLDMDQLHISAPQSFQDVLLAVPLHNIPPPPTHPPPPECAPEFRTIFHLPTQELPAMISPCSSWSPFSLMVDSEAGRSILVRVPDSYSVDGYQNSPTQASLSRDHHVATDRVPAPPPVPPPPVPPPPQPDYYGYYGYDVPPRPPPPSDMAPPRPPPPETDDEEDFPIPQANQPIMMAAHALHMEAKQWSSKDNEIIAAAKRMALLMAKLSQLVRGEGGTKKDLIATAKAIAEASEDVTRLAKKLAAECTDKKMRTNLLNVCERIPTIGTQLKILSTVKATMLGAQEPVPAPDGSEIACGSEEDQEATEMLVGNAQNLMQAVKETVRSAEAASIKIRVDSGYTIRWQRKRPWYT